MKLSIVTTMFYSAPYVEEFHRRCSEAARALTDDYEIVFVNDGSPDDALTRAVALQRRDPRTRVIDLSRNFGHHKAMMTGLEHATGDLIFLVDSDLEEDPAWLSRFHDELVRTNADVIYGVQNSRKGGWLERVTGTLFYLSFNAMLEHPIPRNVVTARLMTRRYVAALVRHRDREVCMAALWVMTGFDQQGMLVEKKSRPGSTYGLRKRISVLVNSVTSFSNRPLIYIFYLGCGIMGLAAASGAYLIARALVLGSGVPGWPSLIVSIWFLGGLTIFCLGVIGVYLAKVFTETKERPYTVVRAEYSSAGERRE
jgi:putative glycosyltransferase